MEQRRGNNSSSDEDQTELLTRYNDLKRKREQLEKRETRKKIREMIAMEEYKLSELQSRNQTRGFGGGGYGQQGQNFNSPGGFGTPQQSQEKRNRQRVQNIFPTTVAQVLDATQNEDKFFVGDTEISQVTLVGLVKSVVQNPTRMDYEIDDCTGPNFEVKQFIDSEDMPPDGESGTVKEKTYVRVSGHVRSFGGKRSIVAYNIHPITDMTEFTCHMLEVLKSNMMIQKGVANPAAGDAGSVQTNGIQADGGDNLNGLTAVQSQVHFAIRNSLSEHGASIDTICKQVRGVPEKQIRECIDFLSSEGHIYSTIDEDHYKATDG